MSGRGLADDDAADALEDALVAYDQRGHLFGSSGAGAYPLATHLVRVGYTLGQPPGVARRDYAALVGAEAELARLKARLERLADKFGATPDWNMSHRNIAASIRTALGEED